MKLFYFLFIFSLLIQEVSQPTHCNVCPPLTSKAVRLFNKLRNLHLDLNLRHFNAWEESSTVSGIWGGMSS